MHGAIFNHRGRVRLWSPALLPLLVAGVLAWHGGRVWVRHGLETANYSPAPEGMVLVPAGPCLIGSNDKDSESDERPLRTVWVGAFYIDKTTVTNKELAKAVPKHTYAAGQDDLPAVNVLRSEAVAYAQAVGKRLPTAAEWEKAARGTDGRRYPWGNDWKAENANVARRDSASTAQVAATGPVCAIRPGHVMQGGSFPAGASPFGVLDMAGNVWEWVADIHQQRTWWGKPLGPARGILKGGAFGYGPRQCRASYNGFEDLDATCHDTGFRCAQDAAPTGGS